MRPRSIIGLLLVLAGLTACEVGNTTETRGRYIYDDAEKLPVESEMALASYLWRLDEKTDYEIVYVFPKEQLDERAMIDRFNNLGVGKKGKDNGAAVFVLPDDTVFVGIGSGNDKVSVTFSKTYGERIFQSLSDDPVLTYLRFASAIGGRVNESTSIEVAGKAVIENIDVILLWAAAIALLFFAVQQIDGFQPVDLVLPAVVFVVLGLFFGVSALDAGASSARSYATYGVITAEKHDSFSWVHIHTVCTTSGKTTTCTSYPHVHTTYTNDVTFLNYDSRKLTYRFQTDEFRGAWDHNVGELDKLAVTAQGDKIESVSGVSDFSGGKTIGDGVMILSGRKR